jgi:hypothetical protein
MAFCALAVCREQAQAQTCDLTYTNSGCVSSKHKTGSGGTGGGTDHSSVCWACWAGGQSDYSGAGCHSCGFEQGEEGEDYAALLEAIGTAPLPNILLLAAKVPNRVHINAGRSALQVRSCNGTNIMAQVPLTGQQLALAQVVLNDAKLAHAAGAVFQRRAHGTELR